MPKDGETQEKSVIAMDGGLFEHYTQFSECMESSLNELLGEEASESIRERGGDSFEWRVWRWSRDTRRLALSVLGGLWNKLN